MHAAKAKLDVQVPVGASSRVRRLLFISYGFPPCVEIGAYSCGQLARYLPLYGWEPIVLTVHERYYEAGYRDGRATPPGRVIRTRVLPHPFALYRRLKARIGSGRARESHGSDSPSQPRSNEGFIGALVSALGVPDDYTGWIFPAVFSGLRACRALGIEHLLSSGPCWTNHLVGLLLARLTGLPWTAHFRDPWAEWPERERTRSRLAARIEATLQELVIRRADAVVCVTERHAQLLRDRYPAQPPDRFVSVPNGYDEAEWQAVGDRRDARETRGCSKFAITYAGTFYWQRSPESIFRAMRHLIDDGDMDGARVQVDLIGWCETAQGRSVSALAAEYGLSGCVRIHGPLDRIETLRRVLASDLLLLLAEDWTFQVPAKAYEYLRAGRSILALAPPQGAVADLFHTTGGAWVVDHRDTDGIARALRDAYRAWLHGIPARAPDQATVADYDRRRLVGRLARALEQGGRARGR